MNLENEKFVIVIDEELPLGIIANTAAIIGITLDKEIRTKLYDEKFKDVVTVDFSDVAQSCKTYEEFTNNIRLVEEKDLTYFGIGMCGPKKLVNKLTKLTFA